MASFFKRFGLGILYVVLLPFILAGLLLFVVWGIINFLIRFVIGCVNFFKGKKFISPLKEDVEAQRILEERIAMKNAQSEQPVIPQQQITNTTDAHNENVVNFNGTINIIQTDPNKPIDTNSIMNSIAQATTPIIEQNNEPIGIENQIDEDTTSPTYAYLDDLDDDMEGGNNG